MTKTSYDIAIVGGGMAGGLAALALARAGFSCAVVDAVAPDTMTDTPFDGRTTAIAYASARLFDRLGLWKRLEADAEPIRDILVTDGKLGDRSRKKHGSAAGFLHFDSRSLDDGSPLGWIVENRHIRKEIFTDIIASPIIDFIAPVRRAGSILDKGHAELLLEDGRRIKAKLVIGADGKNSTLRSEAKIKVNRWSYEQFGIVATIQHELPHRGVAQELFLPAGPFAILPMTKNRSSLVWTESKQSAQAFMALDDVGFVSEITRRTGPYLGEISLASDRWAYPLNFHLSQSFVKPRLALVGDAARAIHPIAGQGFNLGVKDIAALSDVLEDAQHAGEDIGHLTVLERYERWRRFDSTVLALGTDALNRLFSNDIAPIRFARSLGLSSVNKVPALRDFFMRQAGADMGRLPRLMTRNF